MPIHENTWFFSKYMGLWNGIPYASYLCDIPITTQYNFKHYKQFKHSNK